MTTDPRDAEQARNALHKAEKEYCSNFDKGAVFHWAEKGAYVLKADAQAEIARLTAALAEAEAAEEGALMILVQTQAERDAALAQVARLHHLIREASDPDFIWGAMDNVNDMDADITEFANAASRAIRASIPILAAAEKEAGVG